MSKSTNIEQIVIPIIRRFLKDVSVSPVPTRATGIGVSTTPSNDAVLTDTDSLPEGATNLYFTDARVYAAVKALLLEGDNVTITADDEAMTLTIAATGGGGGVDADAILTSRTGEVLVDRDSGNVLTARN